MHLVHRSAVTLLHEAHSGPDAVGIPGRSDQSNAEADPGCAICIESGFGGVLPNCQIEPSIPVEIGRGSTALFAVETNPRFGSVQAPKLPIT